MASQPVDEGGQSPRAPRCYGSPGICKYFFDGTQILTSHTGKLGFYLIASFDPTPIYLLVHV